MHEVAAKPASSDVGFVIFSEGVSSIALCDGGQYNQVMYFVYILKSQKDGSFYTGVTENIDKRIQEHNWHLSRYTSSKVPFELTWYCAFNNKKEAIDFEKYLKSGSGISFRNKHLI